MNLYNGMKPCSPFIKIIGLINRSLQMYLNLASGEKGQAFIDFVMSPAGQKVVKNQDFVPVK